MSPTEVRSIGALYRFLLPGELLGDALPDHAVFRDFWPLASAEGFLAPETVRELRGSKSR